MKTIKLAFLFILLLISSSFSGPVAPDHAFGQTGSEDDPAITSSESPPVENEVLNETCDDPDLNNIVVIRDSAFEVGWPVVLFFHADWCFFCQAMKPVVDEAEDVFHEKAVFLRVNEANNSGLVEAYNVTGFPTFVVVNPEKDNVNIEGYKEPAELFKELNHALGEPASGDVCYDSVGGLFNHHSCSFADCVDECTDQKEIDWNAIGVEALEAALGCLTPFGVPYSCSKAAATEDYGDVTSCLSNGLDVLESAAKVGGPVSPSCMYDLSHLLADMLGAQQLGECLGQCAADSSSYGQACHPGADRMYCVDGQTISMEQCNDECEWGFKPNAPVGTCSPGNCEKTADGAECREEDEEEDPDKPPKRPPRRPGFDHPDDNYDMSTGWLDSQFTWFGSGNAVGEVAILNRGYPLINNGLVEFYRTVYGGEYPELIDITYIPLLNPMEYPVLILPTGSLYGLAGVESVRESLERYTRRGGTLIAFTQYTGTDFELLPGGGVKGYGWQEDTSCVYSAAGITEYHPIFSGMHSSYFYSTPFPVGADGFFLEVPEDSKVLLTRIKNHTPAMIEYEYGAGTVIASTLYSDMVPMGHIYQGGSTANRQMIKNMFEYGRSEKPVPVIQPDLVDPVIVEINFTNPLITSQDWTLFSRGDLVEKDVFVTNYNTTDIDLVSFTVLDPLYNQHTVDVSQTIVAGEEGTVPFSLQTSLDSPPGIWIMLYDLYQGDEWRGSGYSGAFVLDIDMTKLTSFKALYNVTDPQGSLCDQGEISFDLDPSQSTEIEVSLDADTEGLWKIDYRVETVDGLVAKKGTQGVAVSSIEPIPNGFTVVPDFRVSVTSDHEHYPAWTDAEFTVHLWNDGPEDKEVLIALCFFHHYYYTQNWEIYGTTFVAAYPYGSRLNATLTAPAGEYVSYTYVVPVMVGQDTCIVNVLENHGTEEAPVYSLLARTKRGIYTMNGGGRVYLQQDTNAEGQIVVPVTIVGQPVEGTNRFTFQLKDSHGNEKWYAEFEKYMEPKERYTQNITVPIDETWTEPFYYYEAKTYWETDDWSFYWHYTRGHLVIPEVDVDMEIGESYRVGDTVHFNVTYSNPVNLQWTQNTELTINDFGVLHQETIDLPPRGKYTSQITFKVPEGASAGNHQALLHLEQDDSYFNRMIVIPRSNLVTSLPQSLVLGKQESVNITNQGGVPTDCEYIFKILDIYGEEIVSQTGTKTIKAGRALKLNYTLSEQLINTRYTVSVTSNNLDTGKIKDTRVMYDVDGLVATLMLATSKPVYQTGETIQFTADIENRDGEISDGTLKLEISSTEPQSPLTCVVPVDDLVLTEDTVLCPGVYTISDAGSQGIITFGADGIVLDGNGAVISGGGTGFAVRDGGHDEVTIKDLTVNGYEYGVYITGSRNIVYDVQVEGATRGVHMGSSSDHNKVLDSMFVDCYRGIYSYSDNDIIQGNTFDPDTNIGVWLNGAMDTVIYDNLFNDNTYGVQYIGSSYSMPGNITVRKNTFYSNSYAINFEDGSQGNMITENTLQENGRGIWLEYSDGNTVTSNVIEDTTQYGIQVYTGSDENIIANNWFKRNNVGIHLYYWYGVIGGDAPPANHANSILSNSVTDSTSEGILIERDNDATLVANNTITGSGTSGIQLEGDVTNSITVNNTFADGNRAYNLLATGLVGPTDNLFYRNVDQGNSYNSYGISSTYPNAWNTATEGNYWSGYTGTDGDGDGIGDTAYTYTHITDDYPYVEPYLWPRHDITSALAQMTTLPWSTLGPYTIPEAGSAAPGSGGETIWETSLPFNLVDQYLETFTPTSLSEEGKYYLSGQIHSSTGQLVTFNSSSFYVSDSAVYLKLETDKPAYFSMENVEVNATIINAGATQQTVTLTLSTNGTAFYNDQHTVAAGGHESVIAITSSEKNIELGAEIDGFAVTEIIQVHPPSIAASMILPDVATHHPQPVALEILNDGKVPVTLNVEMLDIDTTITLQPRETTLLETEVSVLADTTVTATITGDVETTIQESMLFGEAVTASLTAVEAYLEGEVPVEYNLENTGLVDSYMDILFAIDGHETLESVVVPAGGEITGRQSYNLTAGLYTLSLETPFETITEEINVESPPIFEIIDHPETLDYNLGDLAMIPFTIKNTGVTGGTAHITMKAEGVWEDTLNIMLDPDEESEESFLLPLPDDLETTVITVTLFVDGKQYQTEINLNGVELDVDAALDKTLYQLGEDAQLTITVSNLNDAELELLAHVGIGEHSEEREFTLTSLESTTLVFTVPASFDEKLTYGIYIDSGRAVHINRLYMYEKPDPSAGITLYTDKQVYDMQETATITVETTATGELNISAPSYSLLESVDPGTRTYAYDLPKLRTGTYYLVYSFNEFSGEYPIDVTGYSARPVNSTLNKVEYTVGDDVTLILTISANQDFEGMVKAWILDPDDQPTAEATVDHSFTEGDNTVTLTLPLDTDQPGLHGFAYRIYAYGSIIWLNSGGGYFDVGDTFPPEIIIQSPTSKTYTSTSVPLTYKVDEPTEWASYSLDGAANVTLTGNTTLTGLSKTSHTLRLYAMDDAGNTGKKTVSFQVTTSDGESSSTRPPATPSIEPLLPVTLNEPTNVTMNSVTLSWSESDSEHFKRYTLYQSETDGALGTTINDINDKEQTSQTVDGLTLDTVYFYTVRVHDTYNQKSDSNQVSAETLADTTPPIIDIKSPANFTTTLDEYTLEWSSDEELGYIYLSVDGGENVTATQNYNITGLTLGVHIITIYASDAYGNAQEQIITLNVVDSTPPTIIHFPVSHALGSKPITINAMVSDDVEVETATLYYKAPGETSFRSTPMEKCVGCIDTYSATIDTLATASDEIEYYIQAADSNNQVTAPEEAPQESYLIEINQPPEQIGLDIPEEVTDKNIVLTWAPSTDQDFDNYTLYVSQDPGNLGEPLTSIPSSSETIYSAEDLSHDTTYYFTLRTYDQAGQYADSDALEVTTLPPQRNTLLVVGAVLVVLVAGVYYLGKTSDIDLTGIIPRPSRAYTG